MSIFIYVTSFLRLKRSLVILIFSNNTFRVVYIPFDVLEDILINDLI